MEHSQNSDGSLDTLLEKTLSEEQKLFLETLNGIEFKDSDQGVSFTAAVSQTLFRRFVKENLDDGVDGPAMLICINVPIENNQSVFMVHAFGPKARIGGLHLKVGKTSQMQSCVAAHVGQQLGRRLNNIFKEGSEADREKAIDNLFNASPEALFHEDGSPAGVIIPIPDAIAGNEKALQGLESVMRAVAENFERENPGIAVDVDFNHNLTDDPGFAQATTDMLRKDDDEMTDQEQKEIDEII